jgi:flagellar assembly protein FliH
MILQSDEGSSVGAAKIFPMRRPNERSGDRNVVSRLSFQSIDRPTEEVPAGTAELAQDDAAAAWTQEMQALDQRLQLQVQDAPALIEAARDDARMEARREWQRELEDTIAQERVLILKTSEQFREERDRYFAEVEAEVVRLALAIAARVLHREVNMDPLLLTATVRVALGKMAADSSTVLRVSEEKVELWRGIIASVEFAGIDVKVVGDERMGVGDCVLETQVGKIELGVSAQLSEIETGFFDLLQKRPA